MPGVAVLRVRKIPFRVFPLIYHVLAFDFGDDGGAIGVWREGDAFCARISLDALAMFNRQAAVEYSEGNGVIAIQHALAC